MYTQFFNYYYDLFNNRKWWFWTFFCFLLFLTGIIMFSGAIGYYYMIFSNPDNSMFNVIQNK